MVREALSGGIRLAVASGSISGGQRGSDQGAGSGRPRQSLELNASFCTIYYSLNSRALEQEGGKLEVLTTGHWLGTARRIRTQPKVLLFIVQLWPQARQGCGC